MKFYWLQLQIILKTICFSRIWNYFKITSSYQFSLLLRKPVLFGMPYSLTIEPTNYCNLRCPECPSGQRILKRNQEDIEFDLAAKLIEETKSSLFHINFYFQGEPFLHSRLNELVKLASCNNIYSIISTNGHFITSENAKYLVQSGLSELIVSIDGCTQESYSTYRIGGKLSNVLESIQLLAQAKKELKSKTPLINIQCLVTANNELQLDEMKKLCNDINADKLSLKTVQIYDYAQGNSLIPRTKKFCRYAKQTDGTYKIKSDLKNKCKRLWTTAVVCVDGSIVPCCFDKDGKYKMGNIKGQSLNEIWRSIPSLLFRNQILVNRKGVEICCNCTEGLSE